MPLTEGQFGIDFADYFAAADRLAVTGSPYAPEMLAGPVSAQGLDRYRYPPPLAQVLVPATALGLSTATSAWFVLQLACVVTGVAGRGTRWWGSPDRRGSPVVGRRHGLVHADPRRALEGQRERHPGPPGGAPVRERRLRWAGDRSQCDAQARGIAARARSSSSVDVPSASALAIGLIAIVLPSIILAPAGLAGLPDRARQPARRVGRLCRQSGPRCARPRSLGLADVPSQIVRWLSFGSGMALLVSGVVVARRRRWLAGRRDPRHDGSAAPAPAALVPLPRGAPPGGDHRLAPGVGSGADVAGGWRGGRDARARLAPDHRGRRGRDGGCIAARRVAGTGAAERRPCHRMAPAGRSMPGRA